MVSILPLQIGRSRLPGWRLRSPRILSLPGARLHQTRRSERRRTCTARTPAANDQRKIASFIGVSMPRCMTSALDHLRRIGRYRLCPTSENPPERGGRVPRVFLGLCRGTMPKSWGRRKLTRTMNCRRSILTGSHAKRALAHQEARIRAANLDVVQRSRWRHTARATPPTRPLPPWQYPAAGHQPG